MTNQEERGRELYTICCTKCGKNLGRFYLDEKLPEHECVRLTILPVQSKQEEIRIREAIFPIPGKWTIETKEGGELILINETKQPATFLIDVGEVKKWQLEERYGKR